MALAIYDEDRVVLSTALHAYVDGVSGGVYEFKVFVRNDQIANWYTNVTLEYQVGGVSGWFDPATSRVNVKMFTPTSSSQTGTRPTNLDWASIASSDTLALPDTGSPVAGDTSYRPVWIRVFVPGRTEAQTLDHGLRLTASELVI